MSDKSKLLRRLVETYNGSTYHSDIVGDDIEIECCGISVASNSAINLIENAAIRGIMGAKVRGFGKKTLIYWPKVKD